MNDSQPNNGGFQYNEGPSLPPPPSQNTSNDPSTQAIIALVLGIASWLFGFALLASIPGFIIARKELADIKNGLSTQGGHGFAQAGYWLSLINMIFSAISLVFGIILVLIWVLFMGGLVLAGAAGS